MENKKAQLANLPTGIIALVVAVIMLVIGVVILQELRDSDSISASASATQNNETITTVTETGEALARTECRVACSVTRVMNSTSGVLITSGNYTTLTNRGCTLVSTGSSYNNSNWNVTYSYTYGETACTTANASVVGVGGFSDFVPIIVIALAASIIIGLILIGFAFTQGRQR